MKRKRSALLNKGFTLIETIVALVIFSIAILGILASIITVYKHSIRNLIRTEAIEVAREELNKVKLMEFEDITPDKLNPENLKSCNPNDPRASIKRQVRNYQISFGRFFKVDLINQNLKKVTVIICWEYKGKDYKYSATTLVNRGNE